MLRLVHASPKSLSQLSSSFAGRTEVTVWSTVVTTTSSRHERRAPVAARVSELLERFDLAAKAHRSVAQLSHGEQRRLELAVALAGKPRLLMLDEPTQGMSHGETEDTALLIRTLAREATVLLIEHDIGLVMSLSDRVMVMHQGQKIAAVPLSAR
jgi:branched-chain amino acid transport system ATP-binding protein